MKNTTELLASLSPEKRTLLEKRWLQKKAASPHERLTKAANGPRPLSFAQESVWLFDQVEVETSAHNIPQALSLHGSLNPGALQKAFAAVVNRHESLRTNFVMIDDRPMQVVSEGKDFALQIIDLTRLPERERECRVEIFLELESARPFNLAEDSMIRAFLLRLREDEHILFSVIHHMAGDNWSMSVLHQELTTLYRSFCAGETTSLPELEFQYGDFAIRQRAQFQGEIADKQISYWKERLAGELSLLELPTDRPRPVSQASRASTRRYKFPRALLDSLKELSRREGVTVFATTLAAFQVLLHRYSRQDDILVGCPIGTRNLMETEKLIGFFINTVVLRGDLSGNPTFQQLLHQLHENILGALTNQDAPLDRLVEELKVPRHAGRSPLSQIIFQYLAMPMISPEFDGVTVEPLPAHNQAINFDFSFTLRDNRDAFMVEVEYDTELFEAATIDRMLGHFENLLKGAVANPTQEIARLPILSKAEERQILTEWNDTAVPFPKDATISELLEKQAAENPDAVALVVEEEQLTYRELNERANRLANYLKKKTVRPDDLIGICMERSVEMLVAVHGVLKSGAAFLPLDPEYPAERLQFMMQDAQVPVLLCQHRFAEIISGAGEVIALDADWEKIEIESESNLESKPDPGDLAYVIYTSGSTGQPKGVMISHASICNELFAMQHSFPLSGDDRILQKTSFSFDVAVWELLAPIVSGASLIMAKPGGHRDSGYLVALIAEERITIVQSVPSALHALIHEPQFENCDSLKFVISGGEEMPPELPEEFAAVSEAVLVNSYGPTESSVDAAWCVCPRSGRTSQPIGKPIANTRIYLLDPHLQPTPIGVPGELCIGGRGLARGYLRRPELTAEKFVRNSFSDDPNARLYKTGDLARYRADGSIEFLGRIDHQVKIRGFRIELGEIEMALRSHREVRETVVIAHKNGAGENRLAAYLVASSSSTSFEKELRAHLKTRLPEFMVPPAFVFLEALPLTPNGKLNRRALPPPDYQPVISKYVAPTTSQQIEVARIWSEILGVERIGIHDNFFELGGHSLLATQIISRLRQSGHAVELRELFRSPTVAGLSLILERKPNAFGSATSSIKPLARGTRSAATHLVALLLPEISFISESSPISFFAF